MGNNYYTTERGQQIVIALLKAHGIRKVIASPGATNITLVASMQHDPWFEMYSSVDERSAAYIACGMAAESGEPVVLSCTGATASRNYMPGLTEAYYRKLPIIAITATQGNAKLGHLLAQNIDRRTLPNDIALCSVYVPVIHNAQEEKTVEVDVNRAILETRRRGGGPVHINLQTSYCRDYSAKELPPVRVINRITPNDAFPAIPKGRVAVCVSCHSLMSPALTAAIDRFCATYDAAVFCDHTSGYYGKYRVLYSLIGNQAEYKPSMWQVHTMIHIGEIVGYYMGIKANEVWRISADGELRDSYGKLKYVFEMTEIEFFNHYAQEGASADTYFKECKAEYTKIHAAIPELPFGNVWMAQHLSEKLPTNCVLHLGILNSFRSWNFFETPKGVRTYCNVGGFGIDGSMSTIIGAALARPDKLFFGVFGDLAFFYDLNALGNRHVGNNLRILLVNNGKGTEFRNYNHPGAQFGDDADAYIAAAGHYGNKSPMLVRHYAEDLGYRYLSATTKEEFLAAMTEFTNPEMCHQSIIFECFTNDVEESDALYTMLHLASNTVGKLKGIVKNVLGADNVEKLKKVVR